jgi:hypothetical protein
MTLARFQSTAVDTSGNVIAGASVTVRSQSTGNVVSIFSDRAGTVSLANPFTTDANGFFAFHVAGGTYRITISDGSTNSEITFVGVGRVQENEVIQVSSAGNVGIGTSSPEVKLDVLGSAGILIRASNGTVTQFVGYPASDIAYHGTTTNHPMGFISNDTERMRITSAGNVGIGTSNPLAFLSIGPDTISDGQVQAQMSAPSGAARYWGVNKDTGYGALFGFANSAGGFTGGQITVVSNDPLALFTNNNETMRITSAGNVGIGTSSPDASALLDVTSTVGGVLFPRMTSTQRDAIGSPANGLVLYNTTTDKLQVRAGGSWVDLH